MLLRIHSSYIINLTSVQERGPDKVYALMSLVANAVVAYQPKGQRRGRLQLLSCHHLYPDGLFEYVYVGQGLMLKGSAVKMRCSI